MPRESGKPDHSPEGHSLYGPQASQGFRSGSDAVYFTKAPLEDRQDQRGHGTNHLEKNFETR